MVPVVQLNAVPRQPGPPCRASRSSCPTMVSYLSFCGVMMHFLLPVLLAMLPNFRQQRILCSVSAGIAIASLKKSELNVFIRVSSCQMLQGCHQFDLGQFMTDGSVVLAGRAQG